MRNKNIISQLCHALRGRFYSKTIQKEIALRKADYNALTGKSPQLIFLGDSHAKFAFCPDAFTLYGFNAGEISADLFVAYHLGKNLLEKHPSIQKVVLMLSFYHGGFELSKTSDYTRTALYSKILGLPWRPLPFPCKFATHFLRIKEYLHAPGHANGWGSEDPFLPADYSVQERLRGHFKQATNYGSAQWKYVAKLHELCKQTGKELILCSSPLRSDYRREMHRLFKEHKINPWHTIPNVNAYRFIDSEDWVTDDGFGDMDHVNQTGAMQFSRKLNELLQ